ncbi:type VI secretion system baseplate subunit TssG [Tunicatimonas pelagia]|uniref:type VI secretion system baseplate subunit TssG n=1 Tax=Tunicatimonas pelagia TaxID=931531 RepID=UPI0026667FDA|nr:type VI secretion system baseplate subunit TssG [Tunicatimonas pelagia]WKN41292.1 type VI secretion system baseplate subunit TssG [Tunicatimonas pelagia]
MQEGNEHKDLQQLLEESFKGNDIDLKPEVIIANAIRHKLIKIEDVFIRPASTFQRSYTHDFLSVEKRERKQGNPYYFIDINREGLYDTLPEGLFHQTLKKDAQIDTEIAVAELELHRQEEKAVRKFFLPLEQEFYRLQLLAEWQESQLILASLNRQQYNALINLWDLPKELSNYQTMMMLHIIPLLHRVVGDHETTSNLLSLVMETPVRVETCQIAPQEVNEVQLPCLGEFELGRDSVLGNYIEDYHPHYQLIVGPIEKKYIAGYLSDGKKRKTLLRLCAYFLPCQSDTSVKVEIVQPEEEGFLLHGEEPGEGYLGYTTQL